MQMKLYREQKKKIWTTTTVTTAAADTRAEFNKIITEKKFKKILLEYSLIKMIRIFKKIKSEQYRQRTQKLKRKKKIEIKHSIRK